MSVRAACAAVVIGLVPPAIASQVAGAAGTPSIARGTVLRLQMDAPSLGKTRRTVRVYLPPSYDLPQAADRRYPVVFLLHGWPGSDGNWLSLGKANEAADSLIAAGRIPEVILVFPNGEGAGLFGRSLYVNNYDGSSRMEDFIARDLVAWTDAHFRTRADARHRGILGLSDGASGAFNLTLRHPDVFGACAGHSGQYQLRKEAGMGGVIGPEPGASRLLAANSPAVLVDSLADRLRGVPVYFDVGTDDDDRDDNRAFDRRLTALRVPHTYHEFPGGHGWGYWKRHLMDSLVVLTRGMRD